MDGLELGRQLHVYDRGFLRHGARSRVGKMVGHEIGEGEVEEESRGHSGRFVRKKRITESFGPVSDGRG